MNEKPSKKPRRRKTSTSTSSKAAAAAKTSQDTRFFFLGHKVMDEIKILARLASTKGQEGKI